MFFTTVNIFNSQKLVVEQSDKLQTLRGMGFDKKETHKCLRIQEICLETSYVAKV